MLFKRLTIIALAALGIACSPDRPVLKVGTEGASFERGSVPSTATGPIAIVSYNTWNRGSATAFMPACGGRASAVVERYVGGSWESYASVYCIDIMMQTPVELRPGESRSDQLSIGDAGRFRIRMPYSADAHGSQNLYTLSNAFDVH